MVITRTETTDFGKANKRKSKVRRPELTERPEVTVLRVARSYLCTKIGRGNVESSVFAFHPFSLEQIISHLNIRVVEKSKCKSISTLSCQPPCETNQKTQQC